MQLSRTLDDDSELSGVLLRGFASRFHALLEAALNITDNVDQSALKAKLTLRERQLFDAALRSSRQWNKWKSEKTRSKIEQSSLAGLGRRNKRTRGGTDA